MAEVSLTCVPKNIRGCLSAAFSRAAEILRYKNWDGIRNSEDRTLTLHKKIHGIFDREQLKALRALEKAMREDSASPHPSIDHLAVLQKLGGEGWKELEAAFVAQGDARISTVAMDKGCKFLVLTLCFMPFAKGEAVAQGAPRRAAGGRDVSHCGARHQTGAGGGPRRIGLQGLVDALTD